MSRYADFLQIEAWEVINAGADLDQLCEPADHTKVPYPSLRIGDFSMSLREARRIVSAELRDIDAETRSVVSAIALDETTSQKEVES